MALAKERLLHVSRLDLAVIMQNLSIQIPASISRRLVKLIHECRNHRGLDIKANLQYSPSAVYRTEDG